MLEISESLREQLLSRGSDPAEAEALAARAPTRMSLPDAKWLASTATRAGFEVERSGYTHHPGYPWFLQQADSDSGAGPGDQTVLVARKRRQQRA